MSSRATANPWIFHLRHNPEAVFRLFCFPYAGASALAYRTWPDHLPSSIEVCGILLPGRASRSRERPFTNVIPLVAAVRRAIDPCLDLPFAFFGHSMGALIAFELARLLAFDTAHQPRHLWVSGCRGPLDRTARMRTYDLSDGELKQLLRTLNGTPEELLSHSEAMECLLPLLRADLQVVDTYQYNPGPPLDCPITAFGGIQDPEVSAEALHAWRFHTSNRFSVHLFSGNHFFLHSCEPQALEIVRSGLDVAISAARTCLPVLTTGPQAIGNDWTCTIDRDVT